MAALLPGVILAIWQGLWASLAIPVWAVCLATTIVMGLFVSLGLLWRQNRPLKSKLASGKTFLWRGFEWSLTPQFFVNCHKLDYSQVCDHDLSLLIKGPYCSKCKRDPWQSRAKGGKCASCGADFELDRELLKLANAGDHEVFKRLRSEVYVEAQASVKRGEI